MSGHSRFAFEKLLCLVATAVTTARSANDSSEPQQTRKLRTARRKQDPMSAPNKSYDPRTVAALAPDEVARVLAEALAAVAAAGTLDELKAARIAHEGDRAPLSLASAEIGTLPREDRAEAGRRGGAAPGLLRAAKRRRRGRA